MTCEHCGTAFRASRSDAKFCGDRCRKASRRQRLRVAALAAPFSLNDAIEDVAAMVELLPADLAVLEGLHPTGESDDVDDVLGGLWTHLSSLERLLPWLQLQKDE